MAAESALTAGKQKEIKPKIFVSCSRNDQQYRKRFQDLFEGLYEMDSVAPGDIGSDSSTEYIERLIKGNRISVVSVVIVLVGKDTWGRKHIDWEISAALTKKTDGFSGLMGLCLPTHPAYHRTEYKTEIVPYRLVDNIKSGYARFYDWTESEGDIQSWVKDAFKARINRIEMINNARPLFTDSWSGHADWPPAVQETEPAVASGEPVIETEETTGDTEQKS